MTEELFALNVDLETTGFPLSKRQKRINYIVEIGATLVDLATGEKHKVMDEVVKEEGFDETYKDSWVFDNSDLTFDQVMNGTPMDDLKDQIQGIFDSFGVTAFNTDFDFHFLEKSGFVIPKKYPCIMKSSTKLMKIKVPWGIKYPSVEEAWFYLFDELYVEGHRAYDDVLHEADILLALYELGVWKPEVVA